MFAVIAPLKFAQGLAEILVGASVANDDRRTVISPVRSAFTGGVAKSALGLASKIPDDRAGTVVTAWPAIFRASHLSSRSRALRRLGASSPAWRVIAASFRAAAAGLTALSWGTAFAATGFLVAATGAF